MGKNIIACGLLTVQYTAHNMSSMLLIPILRKALFAIVLITLSVTHVQAATTKSPVVQWDLSSELKSAGFSGTVLVTRAGQTVYQHSFGLAERSFGVPVARNTRFRIASITKLFTSVAVLRLADMGQIDLDAPFKQYLPEYPGPGADKITVRQLLGHMSGLPQFDTAASFDEAIASGLPQYQQYRTHRQLLEMCCSKAPVAAPGQRFDYNNADYIVLGLMIEAVTGRPYIEALDELVLRPAGLRQTGMPEWSQTVPWLARTYFKRPGGTSFENELPFFWENSYAAAGLYSTADDVSRLSDAIFGGNLLSAASRTALLTPAGDEYGLGLWSYSFTRNGREHRVAKRPGSVMGANTMLYRLTDDGLSIVVLANSNAVDLDTLAQRLANAVLDGRRIR